MYWASMSLKTSLKPSTVVRSYIVEPDLQQLVKAAVEAEKLRATTAPEPSDVFIIAVPTPFDQNKRPELKYVRAATEPFPCT